MASEKITCRITKFAREDLDRLQPALHQVGAKSPKDDIVGALIHAAALSPTSSVKAAVEAYWIAEAAEEGSAKVPG